MSAQPAHELRRAPARDRSVAVVGAGLSGLTAAFRLIQNGFDVTVLESAKVPGGRVQTHRRNGFVIDTGACALADTYRAYFDLAGELELRDEIVPCSAAVGIFRDAEIHLLQMDRMLRSFLITRLLSFGSKLKLIRLGWDVGIAALRGRLDYSDMSRAGPLDTESAQAYALRALNGEIDEYIGGPVVRSMLIADTHKISKVELFSGVANIFGSRILALKGGQGRFAHALAERVQPRFSCAVTSVLERENAVEVQFRNETGVLETMRFDACVVACPLPAATALCPDKRSLLEPLQRAMGYTQCITVAVATQSVPDCPAFLIQMPAREDADIALVFLNHNMAPDRSPPGRGLFDCHWETGAAERMMQASDEEITQRTLVTLHRLFPALAGTELFAHVARWPQALPMTSVGAYRAIGRFNAQLDPASRIQFAADFMSAAGQNSAVELGNRAAARVSRLRG